MTRVYFVRHAEAWGNVNEYFQGHIDSDLTERGIAQLEMLSERFKDISFDEIYSSPLKRTIGTTQAANKYHTASIQIDERLIEINGGEWEGVKWAELKEKYPEQLDKWENRMWEFSTDKGESMQNVYNRMYEAVGDIVKKNSGKTIVIVSHGCAIRNYLSYAEFGDIKNLADVGWSDNTAVSMVEYDENLAPTLIFKNDSTHLTEDISTLAHSQWCKYDKSEEEL